MVISSELGDVYLEYKNSDNKTHIGTLRDVNYIPSFW